MLLRLGWWGFLCRRGRTFFIGEVGLVTWFVGLVGGDTVLVEVVVVLLLTDADDGLVFSEKPEDNDQQSLLTFICELICRATHTHTQNTCFSL